MSRIEATFTALKQRQETALIPFITAGDPDLERTVDLIATLTTAGADLIELGIPFSDPMADGPTIQAASERALAGGTTVAGVLKIVAEVRKTNQVPLILMGYYNPIFCYGAEKFAQDAANAGVDALLLVDLPPEEADEIKVFLQPLGIDLITLLAPTTPATRMKELAGSASGYIYYVSMTGVTGAQQICPANIEDAVTTLKRYAKVPVGVGFGIATATDAGAVAAFADGVVVGSALVKIIEKYGQSEKLLPAVEKFIIELKHGITSPTN